MKKQPRTEVLLDKYLETLGLKRKPIAKDGLCLFRAVSEQLFLTQVYHTNLYEACKAVFVQCGIDPTKEWTESRVMEILSLMYRRDFEVYEGVGQGPTKATNHNFTKKIVLCRVDDNQLDSVYKVCYYEHGAICQSILYEILYRRVFQLDHELEEAVSLIREQNKKKLGIVTERMLDIDDLNGNVKDLSLSPKKLFRLPYRGPDKERQKKVVPPVPYRIAKALDPCIYRNVELDIWEEERRDQLRLSPEYRERFSTGDKCQVKCDEGHFVGYIQDIHGTDNTAVVFIEEFGERREVPVSSLKLPAHHRHHFRRRRRLFNYNISTTPTRQSQFSYQSPPLRELDYSFVQEAEDVYQPAPYTEIDNYHTQEPAYYCSDGYTTFGNPYYQTEGVYDNSGYFMMDNVNQVNGMTTYVQSGKTNANQCYTPAQVQPFRPPSVSGPMMNPYYYGTVVPQSPNYVCVPYMESIPVKDVNMNCLPSQDMAGAESPELNTLRFFFNLGVENYRMMCQNGAVWPMMEVNGYDSTQSQTAVNQMAGNTSGQFALPPPPMFKVLSPTSSHNLQHNIATNQNFKHANKQGKELTQKCSGVVNSVKSVNGTTTRRKENTECNDSGCDSDSLGGSAHDDSFKEKKNMEQTSIELEKSIDNFIASKENEKNTNGATEEAVTSSSDHGYESRPKTKKKYYMYGSLRLVKPIKDIPPRFLALLSDSSAERARCEGEPIIIPFLPPKKYHSHHNPHYNSNVNAVKTRMSTGPSIASSSNTPVSTFNPEAKCFVPGQLQSTIIHDPSVVAYCYDTGGKHEQATIADHTNSQSGLYPSSSTPLYVPIQSSTNLGNGSLSNPASVSNHSNSSLLGDGSKVSMHPSFSSTGQACSTYPASVPCPVYFTGHVPYQTGQGYITNGAAGGDMQMYYTAYSTGSQGYGVPPQLQQLPAIPTAQ